MGSGHGLNAGQNTLTWICGGVLHAAFKDGNATKKSGYFLVTDIPDFDTNNNQGTGNTDNEGGLGAQP